MKRGRRDQNGPHRRSDTVRHPYRCATRLRKSIEGEVSRKGAAFRSLSTVAACCATTQGPVESWAAWRRCTKGRCKPSGTEGMPGGGLTEEKRGKARSERPALKPYWGNPAVRQFREGDVPITTPMGAELRPTPKDADKPSDPKVRAPLLYPTVEERQRQPDSTGRDRREKAHDADLRAAGDASRFFSTHCLPVAVARFATGLWHKPALTTLPRST